jgi:transposase-like protein
VISDAHPGLVDAIASTFPGATWQRCRTHFLRNLLAKVPRSAGPFVATLVRSIFAQPDAEAAWAQFHRVVEQLAERFDAAAEMLESAGPDILAFTGFPFAHWKQIWSNNPQEERLNKEIRRRTDVVGIFPNRDAVIRLVGMVLAEQHDVRVEMMRDSPGMPPATMCPPSPGVAFHLSGSSGSSRRALSLDRSSPVGANARVRTA